MESGGTYLATTIHIPRRQRANVEHNVKLSLRHFTAVSSPLRLLYHLHYGYVSHAPRALSVCIHLSTSKPLRLTRIAPRGAVPSGQLSCAPCTTLPPPAPHACGTSQQMYSGPPRAGWITVHPLMITKDNDGQPMLSLLNIKQCLLAFKCHASSPRVSIHPQKKEILVTACNTVCAGAGPMLCLFIWLLIQSKYNM